MGRGGEHHPHLVMSPRRHPAQPGRDPSAAAQPHGQPQYHRPPPPRCPHSRSQPQQQTRAHLPRPAPQPCPALPCCWAALRDQLEEFLRRSGRRAGVLVEGPTGGVAAEVRRQRSDVQVEGPVGCRDRGVASEPPPRMALAGSLSSSPSPSSDSSPSSSPSPLLAPAPSLPAGPCWPHAAIACRPLPSASPALCAHCQLLPSCLFWPSIPMAR
jgi:hypothetical protein